MLFSWSSSTRKSPNVFGTPLCIVGGLDSAVIWIDSILRLKSNSANVLWSFLSAASATGFTVTFMFHVFFSSQARSEYFRFFYFHTVVNLNSKIHQTGSSYILLIKTWSALLAGLSWPILVTNSKWILLVSFSINDYPKLHVTI